MPLDQLSDESCIAILASVGAKYVDHAGYDSKTAAKMVEAVVQGEISELPTWLTHPSTAVETSGPIARRALHDILESDHARLPVLVQAGIAEYQGKQGQVIDLAVLTVGGGILLGLAVLSKLKYSTHGGWELEPGFPQLAEVLEKAGKLIDKVVGSD
jgi:hypothetical protein